MSNLGGFDGRGLRTRALCMQLARAYLNWLCVSMQHRSIASHEKTSISQGSDQKYSQNNSLENEAPDL